MTDKKKTETRSLGEVRWFVSVMIFLLLLASILLSILIVMILIWTKVIHDFDELNLIRSMIILSIVSLIIGTSLTALFGNSLIRTIAQFNDGLNALAAGRFDTRIHIRSLFKSTIFDNISSNFNDMAEHLEKVEVLNNDFINDFSHEFKTPIVSIEGFAKILKKKDISEEERDEYLDIIIHEAEKLTELSSNVLSLSRIDNELLLNDIESFDLTEQVRQAAILLYGKCSDKQQTLTVELDEVSIEGNREYLELVWKNLIDNAIKYTPEHGEIGIDLIEKEDKAVFSVTDNGIGISEEVQKRMFEKFYQGDPSHGTAGNGIGLALVDKVVRLHKGSVTVDSQEKKGTTMTVILPLKQG